MQSETPSLRPRIRILHQLARSGGTVICRCLASMQGVVLLSEIHPQGLHMFNPLQQAVEWYGLLRPTDLAHVEAGKLSFAQAIGLIAERCAAQDRILILRDWNHLDFIGLPFTQPGYRPLLAATLQADFELIRFATVRHPLDQWLSLSRNPLFAARLPAGKYLKGVRRFAEMASGTGMLHYEDFTENPDSALTGLCAALSVPFDPAYRQRWASYKNITGDVLPGRSEAGEISTLPRQDIAAEARQAFEDRADYQRILELMNYTDSCIGNWSR
jgi:protein O-GlcNAc transferase